MSIRNLDKLFRPRSVALFGASPNPGTVGAVVMRNLMRAGFKGRIMLVNPHHESIAGVACCPDVAHLPETPDLAVIATPPQTVPGLLGELGARGTKAAVIITAGFGELGEQGRALQQQALDAAQPHLLRLVGPNCVGIMMPGIGLDASFSHIPPLAGELAFVSQSGAMITAVLDWAAARGIGFSHIVSLGDMADVDFGDTIDYLGADPGTSAILLYVEGITHARKFMSAARQAARAKPVLAVKVGRFAESARAARSHTGALAGSDAVYDAAFRRAGMLRVFTMAELFDAVETLAQTRAQRGDRIAILTNGGGPGVLATDAVVAEGGSLAALAPETLARLDGVLPRTWSRGNPVDIIGDADGARYGTALDILLSDPGIDAVLALNCPTALASAEEGARAVIDSFAKAPPASLVGRNLFTAWLGESTAADARRLFSAAHIATYDTPDSAVRGFMHRVHYRRNQELLMETPEARLEGFAPDAARADAVMARATEAGREWLDVEEAFEILTIYGVSVPACRVASDAEAAGALAAAIGCPVALKIRSPDITHKSDIGGVALDLGDPERVRAEAQAMLARVAAAKPDARLEGFLVQQMIRRPAAIELIVGITDDASFGPVIMFGHGGVTVELMGDTTLELPPLNEALARAQIGRTRVSRLIEGYRGTAPADRAALVDTLLRISQLAAEQPRLKELDINPLLADAGGVIALDARIRVQAPSAGKTRLAIMPYPKALESGVTLRDGTVLRLRPIRPEDETLLHDIAGHMDAKDLRLRFFAPMKGLTHLLAARLSQIDYDREMALVALTENGDTAVGVVRFAADPDNQRAEFAIGLRSDWQGRGLGWTMMGRIIEVAQARGIGELFGDVLRENERMVRLCRDLGFTLAPQPDAMDLVRVSKRLA
ncbi:MAG TPA: bifunctional acetate--CoA ligase family protein/GNAT family N-acetyltransferase [Stellaceae bacterium]|nr:bifunctional acetate--CoA ligase family protein/GNAT family N-acetyltransferase [Stellaceae bacterium]